MAGLLPGRHRSRPFGRPTAGRRADFGSFPVAVRSNSAGPEALLRNIEYFAVNKFWIVVRKPRNRSEIVRNQIGPVCPGIFGLVSSASGADWGPKSAISWRILGSFRGPFSYLRLVTHFRFLIVGMDEKMVTKWPYNWPRDPFQRVGLEKWCRTHPKLAPETNSKAVWLPFSGPDEQ